MTCDYTDSRLKSLFPLWSFILIAVAALIAYSPSIDSAFHLDDIPFIVDANIAYIPWRSLFFSYPTRWLCFFTYKLNALASGSNTISYHLVNLLLHIITAWMITLFVYTLHPSMQRKYPASGRSLPHLWSAFFIGLIFAVHPLVSQPVIYISQRLTLAWSLCAVTVLLLCARALKTRHASLPSFFVATIVFFIALFCKEIAVVIPLLVIAYFLIFHGVTSLRKLRWFHWLAIFAAFLFILILPALLFVHLSRWNLPTITRNLQGVGGKLHFHSENLTRLTYALTQPKVVLSYLRLCLFPSGLNIDHDIPVCTSALSSCFLIPFSTFILLLCTAFLLRKKAPLILWGLLVFFIPLLPQSSFIPSPDLMFEHRAYLSVAGIIICGAGCLDLFLRYFHHIIIRRIAFIFVCIIPFVFIYATFMRAETWETELSLWHDAYRKSPKKQRVAINYANALFENGEADAAQHVITDATTNSHTVFPEAAMSAGNIAFYHGNLHIALTNYITAIRHSHRHKDARFNIAMTYLLLDEEAKAIHHLNMITRIDRRYADAYFIRGKIYSRTPDTHEKACTNFVKYLTLAPNGEYANHAHQLLHSLTNTPKDIQNK